MCSRAKDARRIETWSMCIHNLAVHSIVLIFFGIISGLQQGSKVPAAPISWTEKTDAILVHTVTVQGQDTTTRLVLGTQCLRQLRPLKQTMRKMMSASTSKMAAMMSFIFIFCHHILLRSCRPVLWNRSACHTQQNLKMQSSVRHLSPCCRCKLWSLKSAF